MQEAVRARSTSDEKKVQPPDCFLTQLVELTSNETEITDQLLNVLLAGRDTTAGLLSIQFHILARRPDVWAKVRADVSSLEGRQPSFRELRDLKYVSWVISESASSYLSSDYRNSVLTKSVQLSASTRSSRVTSARPLTTPCFRPVAARMVSPPSSCPRA